jgi:hypothetical protein
MVPQPMILTIDFDSTFLPKPLARNPISGNNGTKKTSLFIFLSG